MNVIEIRVSDFFNGQSQTFSVQLTPHFSMDILTPGVTIRGEGTPEMVSKGLSLAVEALKELYK